MKRLFKIIFIEVCLGIVPIVVGILLAKYHISKTKAKHSTVDV